MNLHRNGKKEEPVIEITELNEAIEKTNLTTKFVQISKLYISGDVRLLQHKESKIIRLLMRREKTLRICANHFIRPWMILKPMKGSDRAFTWQVHADFAGMFVVNNKYIAFPLK